MKIIKKLLILVLILITTISFAEGDITSVNLEANKTISISGNVVDITTNEALSGVEITVKDTNIKIYTDFDGNFKIENLPNKNYKLILSYVSYDNSLIEDINFKEDLKIKLKQK